MVKENWYCASEELNSAYQVIFSFTPTEHRSHACLVYTPESGVLYELWFVTGLLFRWALSSLHFQGFIDCFRLFFSPYWLAHIVV